MKYFLLLVSLFSLPAASREQNQPRLLTEAYRSNSLQKLELFFDNWAQESYLLSLEDTAGLNDSVQVVYQVFKEFYNPAAIHRAGGPGWENAGYKYFVVQSYIRVGYVDTLDKEQLALKEYTRVAAKLHISVDSVIKGQKTERLIMKNLRFDWPIPDRYGDIYEFRPRMSFQNPRPVILSYTYDSLFNAFLGTYDSLIHGNNQFPVLSKDEIISREKFLGKCIKTRYNYWGKYWQLDHYPYVDAMILDKTLTNALVNYSLAGEGGYVYFKKVNGNWMLMEAGPTWIE